MAPEQQYGRDERDRDQVRVAVQPPDIGRRKQERSERRQGRQAGQREYHQPSANGRQPGRPTGRQQYAERRGDALATAKIKKYRI